MLKDFFIATEEQFPTFVVIIVVREVINGLCCSF